MAGLHVMNVLLATSGLMHNNNIVATLHYGLHYVVWPAANTLHVAYMLVLHVQIKCMACGHHLMCQANLSHGQHYVHGTWGPQVAHCLRQAIALGYAQAPVTYIRPVPGL